MNERATSAQGMLQAGDQSHCRDVHWLCKTLDLLHHSVTGLLLVTPHAEVEGLQ